MNPNINRLAKICQKDSRFILGLMSGTSLDGLDLAYCKVHGSGLQTKVELIHFDTAPYPESFKSAIRQVFAKPEINFPYFTLLHRLVAQVHARIILDFLERHHITSDQVDLIASHGQTVMHVPENNQYFQETTRATLQIGDGDQIAVATGIITLSDFRQKHVAAGGEGAPLAVYGDYLLNPIQDKPVILLNIGGIANFTYLPPDGKFQHVFVSDTGPGNTLIDGWMSKYLNQPFDKDGQTAAKGTINQTFLQALLEHPFFKRTTPKSTGPEDFNLAYVEEILRQQPNPLSISNEDILATLTALTVSSIVDAIKQIIGDSEAYVYLSGGGAHNLLIRKSLQNALGNCLLDLSEKIGIPGDAKEAIIFALLANETIAGDPATFAENPLIPGISMGKISFPA